MICSMYSFRIRRSCVNANIVANLLGNIFPYSSPGQLLSEQIRSYGNGFIHYADADDAYASLKSSALK